MHLGGAGSLVRDPVPFRSADRRRSVRLARRLVERGAQAAGELIVKGYYHLGVAVAAQRGLIVPVIRDVDQKPIVELQRELAALAQRVREGKATL